MSVRWQNKKSIIYHIIIKVFQVFKPIRQYFSIYLLIITHLLVISLFLENSTPGFCPIYPSIQLLHWLLLRIYGVFYGI